MLGESVATETTAGPWHDRSAELSVLGLPDFPMKDHVYKLIELTGTSTISMEEAVQSAIQRAHKTVKNLSWFQVTETRGNITKGKIEHWQVTLKIGFRVQE